MRDSKPKSQWCLGQLEQRIEMQHLLVKGYFKVLESFLYESNSEQLIS